MKIEIKNLSKIYNKKAVVDNVSFIVEEGSSLVLLGTSGCGKTTTLKMINRLIEPTLGEIYIGNKEVRKDKPEKIRKQIGYVIQNIGLFPHYTVGQNIAIVPNLLRWDKESIESRVEELLEMVGLPHGDFVHRYPDELSGGQRQRVGFARALAADPPIILLDEPFGALDPITRFQLQNEFNDLLQRLHKTIILVTHDIFEAFFLGKRICLMHEGKIQQIGTPKELIFTPKNEYVHSFFEDKRFQLELTVIKLADILPQIATKERNGEKAVEYHSQQSLLDVLDAKDEHISTKQWIHIMDKKTHKVLKTTFEEVLTAYYKTRAKLYK